MREGVRHDGVDESAASGCDGVGVPPGVRGVVREPCVRGVAGDWLYDARSIASPLPSRRRPPVTRWRAAGLSASIREVRLVPLDPAAAAEDDAELADAGEAEPGDPGSARDGVFTFGCRRCSISFDTVVFALSFRSR